MKKTGAIIAIIAIIVLLVSCATEKNNIVFSPIPQAIPASASASLYFDDKIWTINDYEIIKEFAFDKRETIKLTNRKEIYHFNISKELEELKRTSNADAIVDLKIELKSIKHLDSNLIVLERCVGFIGISLLLYGIDGLIEPELATNDPMQLLIPGGIITATSFGGSLLHEQIGNNKYNYSISGKLVRLKK